MHPSNGTSSISQLLYLSDNNRQVLLQAFILYWKTRSLGQEESVGIGIKNSKYVYRKAAILLQLDVYRCYSELFIIEVMNNQEKVTRYSHFSSFFLSFSSFLKK